MKIYLLKIICLFILSFGSLNAQIAKNDLSLKANQKTLWKGFDHYDFQFEQRDTRLIVPNHPLPGNPWIWRARFPDWHTEADSILVTEGFHIVYINTDNKFGSPDAVAIWDRLYKHVVEVYKLQKEVALVGVSRGGLFVYNWAKKNPEKVACIYAEAPVCDFKSWPAGFGTGKPSPKDWENLKKEYGFNSDEEARAYSNNPIDNLEALAREKIPVLHMIGLDDKIVPPNENTFPLINEYIRLGGIATVVPCTEGIQKLDGHHFPIETPRIVADFIKYHSLQNMILDASNYHTLEGGLQNSQIRFERDKKGRVAFVGGSITFNSGWRDSICVYLTRRFPETEFEFIAAGIPSMGTTPASFRLERDVLSHGRIDLLFEEAAVNDAGNGRQSIEQIRAMEGIIRHLRNSNPTIDIIMMHFVDPSKIDAYRMGEEPEVIRNHNIVAAHYNIPTINLAKEVTDRIDNNEFNWKNDFKDLHPSPFGQGIYARSMIHFLDKAFAGQLDNNVKISPYNFPDKLDQYCYDKGHLIDISTAKRSKGWHIDPSWAPDDGTGVRQNYYNVPMLISSEPGSTLEFKFEAKAVGIAVAAGQDAGIIEYRVDNKEWHSLNLFTPWSSQLHLPWYYTLFSELSENEHMLEIRIAMGKDEKSVGHACRIRYFYLNSY